MFVLACAVCAHLALAPTASPTATPVPQIAHVYTSDRSDTTLKNTARTIYVITHDQLVNGGYQTIAQALEGVPALHVAPFGPVGSSANFSLRGSSSAQVLVLIDGLPAPGSFSNTVELGNLPTTGVDRIEVVEGGGSTLYGTGAIGGIINIITQRSAQTGVTLRAGSFGERQLELRTQTVQYSRLLATNAFPLPDASTRQDVDYESSAFHAGAQRTFANFTAVVRGSIFSDELGAPGPQGPYFSPTSRESDLNETANLLLTRNVRRSELTVQFGGTEQRISFSCSSADGNCAYPEGALGTEGRVDFGARNRVVSQNGSLLYGVDLSRGVVRSDSGGFASPPVSIDAMAQSAAYAQERFDTRWGGFYTGLRGERDGALGGEVSPSLGIFADLSPDMQLKMNAATAFRAPNASELYFPGYGNRALKPERAKVADLTLTMRHFLGGLSLGWFGNRTNDLIVAQPVSTTYEPRNVNHALIEGLTLDVRTPEQRGLSAAFTITDLYRAADLDADARLPNDPAIAANLSLDFRSHRIAFVDGAGVVIRVSGSPGAPDPTLPQFDRAIPFTNVGAYLRLRPAKTLYFTLRESNLGNERYAAVNGYPLPGRSFAFELSTR